MTLVELAENVDSRPMILHNMCEDASAKLWDQLGSDEVWSGLNSYLYIGATHRDVPEPL